MDTLTTITSEYKRQFIDDIINGMEGYLDNNQLIELNKSLNMHTNNLIISENPRNIDLDYKRTNKILLENFIKSKKIKGLSKNSIYYYEKQLNHFLSWTIKSFIELNSDDLKDYLKFYQDLNNCSPTTLNNHRRILSSFYNWLELEEKIIMNPMKRIPRIKTPKKVRKAFTDEEVELLRNEIPKHLNSIRNTAIFELLLSSGLRLSEVTSLKKTDINLVDCKGVVMGKGGKQRVFYFSERCKISLMDYLDSREDDKKWLFVSGKNPYHKYGKSGLGNMIKELGGYAGVNNTHPHRFRRTLATRLVRKGMPLEQVSKILGHENIGVTMTYVETDNELLKLIHNKHTN